MFNFLPKSWNLWLHVECFFTRDSNHGELDQAGESNAGDLDVKLSSYAKLGVLFWMS